jgi:tyrosine-specific transport protein
MNAKLIGSILLIVGTTIGAGMLALPIATAQLGFIGSLLLLFICWLITLASTLLLLEVNLWLPQKSHLVSMAKATLGGQGELITWISYLFLLYALLCAYIAGGSDLFHSLLRAFGFSIPTWATAILFTFLFGSVAYFGIRAIDYVNRGLMCIKLGAYFFLTVLLLPFVSPEQLTHGDLTLTDTTAWMVTITSFGFAAIVPSLRVYFASDIRQLKIALLVGSFIPLICYILWDIVIMGVIPHKGDHGLIAIAHSQQPTSELVQTFSTTVARPAILFFAKWFTSVCVVTSFLGVALCLSDFLADGLRLEKQGWNQLLIQAIAFLPPLSIVLFYPNMFITALRYAGVDCCLLLILLPALMAWYGRYRRHLAHGYRVPGGKGLLIFLILFSLIMIGGDLIGHRLFHRATASLAT